MFYPYGEDNATRYTREAQESDTVIVDNKYVTAIVTGYEYDDLWGYTANLYLVNKTQSSVMFSAEDVSVNGYMCDPFYATKEIIRLLGIANNNINQIAHKFNATGRIYDADLEEVRTRIDGLYDEARKILIQLSKIK